MIPRCPDCGRIVVRERLRLFHQGGTQPSPHWWCSQCKGGTRVTPVWLPLQRQPRNRQRKRQGKIIERTPQRRA